MEIHLNMYQTLAVAVLVLLFGSFLRHRIGFLEKFCIPAPVIGGLLFAILTCIGYSTGLADFTFDDTDILIQESEGKLLKDIIADVGPDGFLKVEDRVNAQVKAERTVISPGGSVVYCENAMKHYKEIGKVVYLQASFETINSRLKNAKGRGVVLRDGQTLKDLYDERVKLFEKYADITVCEDNQKLEDTIESVLDALGE